MLYYLAAQALGIQASQIRELHIRRKSLDARKKPDLRYTYTVDVALHKSEKQVLRQCRNNKVSLASDIWYRPPKPASLPDSRPVVVGFGPAGMFAALVLAMAGLRPIVLERGQDAETRHRAVAQFWQTGVLDPECNVQFGEGGAGTFSDGKLNTGTRNERQGWVLRQLVRFGADESILWDAKPHVGTDVLLTVVQALRSRVIALGGEVRFGAKLTGLETDAGRLKAAVFEQNGVPNRLPCERLILAPGHSARDTFRMLDELGLAMEPKPFSMGVRIEHLQAAVNRAQYGEQTDPVPAADYKLNVHLPDGSSAYTFCMCPGGYVVGAASERGRVVTKRHEQLCPRGGKRQRSPAGDVGAEGLSGFLHARRNVLAAGNRRGRLSSRRRQLPRSGAAGRRLSVPPSDLGMGKCPAHLPSGRHSLRAARGSPGAADRRFGAGHSRARKAPARV